MLSLTARRCQQPNEPRPLHDTDDRSCVCGTGTQGHEAARSPLDRRSPRERNGRATMACPGSLPPQTQAQETARSTEEEAVDSIVPVAYYWLYGTKMHQRPQTLCRDPQAARTHSVRTRGASRCNSEHRRAIRAGIATDLPDHLATDGAVERQHAPVAVTPPRRTI